MSSNIEDFNNAGFISPESAWEALVYYHGNLIDVIAATRGRNPLKVYEEMTVTYGEKRYVICRLKDEEE